MDAYTAKQIAEALQITQQAVNKRAARDGWTVAGTRRARGGGKLYALASLPEDVRAAVVVREAERGAPRLPGAETAIPEWANQRGLDRYRVVHEFLAYHQRRGGTKGKALDLFLEAFNAGLILPQVAQRLGTVSRPTLYRWEQALRESDDDYRALCDRRGKWTAGGAKGAGQLDRHTACTVLDLWLDPRKPSVSAVYRMVKFAMENEGKEVPSERTVRRFLKRYEREHADIVVLKREGEKAYKDKIGAFLTRDQGRLAVGDVCVADGHVLNFQVRNPFTGKPERPVLLCWFDWASRLPVGWEIMPTENPIAVASAYRMACLTYGKPARVAYLDNGSAFRDKYFTKTDADLGELNGLYARLGTGVQFAAPYNAREKVVERFFRTLDQQFEVFLAPYVGPDVSKKPAYMLPNEPYHTAKKTDYVPTIAEAATWLGAFVAWYGMQPHRGLDGQRPMDVLEAGRGPGMTEEQVADLDRHFRWRFEATPRRCRITIPGTGVEYENDALHGRSGKVLAMYSWADLSRVHLYTMDGTPLGEALPVESVHPMAEQLGDRLDLLLLREAQRRQKRLRAQTMAEVRELDKTLATMSAGPVLHGRSQRLQLVDKPEPKRPEQPAMSAEEKARLTAVAERARQERAAREAAPAYTPPDYFPSRLDRYDFLFGVSVKQGLKLRPEDAAFMAEYEQSAEWADFGSRYQKLRALYARLNQTTEVAG
jgi:putative transposase